MFVDQVAGLDHSLFEAHAFTLQPACLQRPPAIGQQDHTPRTHHTMPGRVVTGFERSKDPRNRARSPNGTGGRGRGPRDRPISSGAPRGNPADEPADDRTDAVAVLEHAAKWATWD